MIPYLRRRWRLKRERRAIEASGSFDSSWYLWRYPELAAAGVDPLQHYTEWGCREGRFPNPVFDSGWYLAYYFPQTGEPPNPLIDYLRHLRKDERRPNRWFDPGWYRAQAKVAAADDTMLHYLRAAPPARDPSPDFDSAAYLARYPDLLGHATPLGFYLHRYRIRGHIGECTSRFINGWAGREVGPPAVVTILINGRVVGEVAPWIERPDVRRDHRLAGLGFYFSFPRRLALGDVVTLRDEAGEAIVGCQTTYELPALGASTALHASRAAVAATFLFGRGVEIGAFTQPTDLPPDRNVVFYDRFPGDVLRRDFFNDADGQPLIEPDYVGDAQTLNGLPEARFDFLIANHVMEHLEDPILFLERVAATLLPGGRAMLAVPDMRYCADAWRKPTTFEHLVADHEQGPSASRADHFLESAMTEGFEGQAAADHAAATDPGTTLVHYHVWTPETFVAFVRAAQQRYRIPLTLLYRSATTHEIVVVLERAPHIGRT